MTRVGVQLAGDLGAHFLKLLAAVGAVAPEVTADVPRLDYPRQPVPKRCLSVPNST
jgi:hypothetical protein